MIPLCKSTLHRPRARRPLASRVEECRKTIDSFDPALQLPEPNPRASRLERCRDISFSLQLP